MHKHGSGTSCKYDSPTRRAVLELAVTPPDHRRRHSSQREIYKELGVSKGYVQRTIEKSNLKCFRRIRCHVLTEAHRQTRKTKCDAMLQRFGEGEKWKQVWFSDESTFCLSAPLNRQNERIYRAMDVKTDIPDEDLLVEIDKQQTSIMCYGAVSWHGKTDPYFIEGDAAGQESVAPSRRKKKTVNQVLYREDMCPQMFEDIDQVMQGEPWTWQQDGAKSHTANDTVAWLRVNTPDFITPQQWPSKSSDLNVMDYCIWSVLLQEVQRQRRGITDTESLKHVLMDAWNNMSLDVIRRATQNWMDRLRRCSAVNGQHFERYL